ncbi:response regulator transcription factor [Streptomyces sp. V4-01]|uniref:Response regulator transcription factor n=1 Tax=Actinacidiphila polyblastidii TaxID=3110430 RepID=A0ABU7PF88_9ACTN|nr:response regulator transcription factor [Streptomyces sp. V4-01]
MSISVVIADDQAMVRTGFRLILESVAGFEVAGEAANGDEAVELVRRVRPDVVLMDIRMPGIDGLRATEILTQENPDLRVVILTTYGTEKNLFAALGAGAVGFLLKDSSPRLLVAAVQNAVDGTAMLSAAVAVPLIRHFSSTSRPTRALEEPLTPKETDVVRAVAEGRTNVEISERLGISTSAVKARLCEAQRKLGTRNRTEVAIWAWQNRLVA